MSDLISRSKAIRWVKAECNPYGQPTLDYESGRKVIEHLERMPSAEPKTPSNGSITSMNPENTHDRTMGDLISRADAIDAVEFGITHAKAINKSTGEVKELFKEGNKALNEAVERLKECAIQKMCNIRPEWGEQVRYNCPMFVRGEVY